MTGIDEQYSRYAMSIKLGFADGDEYSLFRIVPGDEFVANFASDRTHMVRRAQDRAEDVDQPEVISGGCKQIYVFTAQLSANCGRECSEKRGQDEFNE